MVTVKTAKTDFGPFGFGCPHAVFPPSGCIYCDYPEDANITIEYCKKKNDGTMTYHLDGKCIPCEAGDHK